MPRIRLLADLATGMGSAINGATLDEAPAFDVAPGSTVPIVLDATGFVGADSIASSVWDASGSVTLSARTIAGKRVSCNAYVGDGWTDRRGARVENTLTLNSGLIRKTVVWLRSRRRGEWAA